MGDELRDILESVRARVQAELDGQLRTLNEKHQQALVDARRAAEAEGRRAALAEAEQALNAKLQGARDEALRRAHETITAVRSELEREHATEVIRIRGEAEQQALEAATHAAARVRGELEQALAAERAQAQAQIDAERAAAQARIEAERAQVAARAEADRQQAVASVEAEKRRLAEELQNTRAAFDGMRAADRAAHDAARSALEAQLAARSAPASPTGDGKLIGILREIDGGRTLSDTLTAIARAAGNQAPRAAVFVASGEQLREWEVPGTPTLSPAPLYVRDTSLGVIGEAVRTRELVRNDNGGAPAFAGGNPQTAVAVPLMLDGHAVGIVYGDGANGSGEWVAALDAIASHGSARLGYITAMRTVQAMRWLTTQGEGATLSTSPSSDEEEQAARRYARLLVSEIKLYNEGAVRAGRENRDLLRRLAEDIRRARRLFEERVPASVASRAQLFDDQLVQTLADGDASLLG